MKTEFAHRKSDDKGDDMIMGDNVSNVDDTISEGVWNQLRAKAVFDERMDSDKDVITSVICSIDALIHNLKFEPHNKNENDEKGQKVLYLFKMP